MGIRGEGDTIKMAGRILLVLEKCANEWRKKATLKLGFLIDMFCTHNLALNVTFQEAGGNNKY